MTPADLNRGVALRAYTAIFGLAPFYRRAHPRWSDVQPILKALRGNPTARVLHVVSGKLDAHRFAPMATETLNVREVLESGEEANRAHATSVLGRSFDICIVELGRSDLVFRSRQLIARVLPSIRDDGRIFVFYQGNLSADPMLVPELIDAGALTSEMENQIYLSGTGASVMASALFDYGVGDLKIRSPRRVVLGFMMLCAAALIAGLANWSRSIIRSRRAAGPCTSMTIEFVPRGYRPGSNGDDSGAAVLDEDRDALVQELLDRNRELRNMVELLEARKVALERRVRALEERRS